MKRLEIFPYKERREMVIQGNTKTDKSGDEEAIFRLKQLLLKYFNAVPEEKWIAFTFRCPLCESYSDNGDLRCTYCPWRGWAAKNYSNFTKPPTEVFCNLWAEEQGIGNMLRLGQFEKVKKKRVTMIYKWVEELMMKEEANYEND